MTNEQFAKYQELCQRMRNTLEDRDRLIKVCQALAIDVGALVEKIVETDKAAADRLMATLQEIVNAICSPHRTAAEQ